MVLTDMTFYVYFFVQYADPVADLLDKWGVFRARLFRESCVFHRGNYIKVRSKNSPLSNSPSPLSNSANFKGAYLDPQYHPQIYV